LNIKFDTQIYTSTMTLTIAIKLKEEIIGLIRNNKMLKNKLQLGLNISSSSLGRYLSTNDEKLTTATALKIISEELQLTQDQLLTQA